jgi:hypothetical protein
MSKGACSRLLLAACLGVISISPVSAQEWAHSWGGSAPEGANSVARDSAGNVYVVGDTSSFGAGWYDVLLLKFDSSGNLVWARTWGGQDADFGGAVAVDQAGGIYVAGQTASFGAGSYDALLLKFDSSGNLLWARTWGGEDYDAAYDIALDADGGLYLAAESYSFGNSAVLLKFGSGGDLVLSRTWKGPATYDAAYSVDVDDTRHVVVAGISWDYSVSPNHNSVLLLKYDSQGNLVWSETWGAPWPAQAEALGSKVVKAATGGNVYVASKWASSCLDPNFAKCDFDASVFKLDATGNLIWSRTWGGAGYDTAYGLALDAAGNVAITGKTLSFSGERSSAMLLSYDPSGNPLLAKIWGADGSAIGVAALADPAGGFLMAGSAPNANGNWGVVTSSAGPATGSIATVSGSVGSPSAVPRTPLGSVVSATGIVDSGGGGSDVLLVHTSTSSPGGCVRPSDCEDLNACTVNRCINGVCDYSQAVECDDGNACTDDSCNRATGCVWTNNTKPCDDGNACTTNDRCSGGVCTAGTPLSCDDGNACNGVETCDSLVGCRPGTPPPNICEIPSCASICKKKEITVGGQKLNGEETLWVRFIAQHVVPQLSHYFPNRNERLGALAEASWWGLKEGAFTLPGVTCGCSGQANCESTCSPDLPALNPQLFSNCSRTFTTTGNATKYCGNFHLYCQPLTLCDPNCTVLPPHGVCPWQVGIAAAQVPRHGSSAAADSPDEEAIRNLVENVFPTRTFSDVLEETAQLAGFDPHVGIGTDIVASDEECRRGLATNQGDSRIPSCQLRRSWLLRHPAVGLTYEDTLVRSQCIRLPSPLVVVDGQIPATSDCTYLGGTACFGGQFAETRAKACESIKDLFAIYYEMGPPE